MRYLIIEAVAAKPHLETSGEIALSLRDIGHEPRFAWVGDSLPWNDWELPPIARLLGGSLKRRCRNFQKLLKLERISISKAAEISPARMEELRGWAERFDGT